MIKKGHILLTLILLLIVADILTVLKSSLFGITGLLWLFLLYAAGKCLLYAIIGGKKLATAETALFSAGLSVVLVYALGVVLNTIGLLSHRETLVVGWVLPAVNTVLLLLLLTYGKKIVQDFRISPKRVAVRLSPFLIPIITIVGAVQLNNDGPGVVAIVSLSCIVVISILAAWRKKILSDGRLLATILFAVSLGLVLSVSMRSGSVMGYDIFGEYREFTNTLQNGIWNFSSTSSTYAGCLSITVLPTILATLIPVASEFIFKFYMQFILCLLPLVVYVIATRLYRQQYGAAFIAGVLFIAPGQFIFQFPALIRQQAALLFFGLIFLALTNKLISQRARFVLMVLFGLGMVMSHYSTTYICIAFLIIYWVLQMLIKLLSGQLRLDVLATRLDASFVLLLCLFSFFWFGQFFQNSGGITEKLQASLTNLTSAFDPNEKSPFINFIFGSSNESSAEDFQAIEKSSKVYGAISDGSEENSAIIPTQQNDIVIDSTLKNTVYSAAHRIVPLGVNVTILAGLVLTLIISFKRRQVNFLTIAIPAGLILMMIMIILPSISKDYNFERLYQQFLIFFAPALVVFISVVGRIFRSSNQAVIRVSLGVALMTLVCASGLVDQLAFGSSNVNLSNSGANYNHFYVRQGELSSAQWLERSAVAKYNVNVDNYSQLTVRTFTDIPDSVIIRSVLPTTIRKESYIYASDNNVKEGVADQLHYGKVYSYIFPKSFNDANKNVIYANNDSIIYR